MQLTSAGGQARIRIYDSDGTFTERESLVTEDETDARSADDGTFVWIELIDNEPAHLKAATEAVGLHPLAVEDIVSGRQQPKVQWFDDRLFVALRVLHPVATDREPSMSELYIFARPGLLLTVGRGDDDGTSDAVRALDRADPAVLAFGTLGAVHALVSAAVRGYLVISREIEDELEQVEDQVFDEEQKDDALRIYRLRRRIGRVDRAVTGLAVAFENARERLAEYTLRHPGLAPYISDLIADLASTARLTSDQEAALDSVISTHENAVASQQNSDSRTISAFAALLAIPAVVAGLYGMNFKNLPATDWAYGWVLITGAIIALELWALYALKRRHWF
ncbi:CorA family divalent cation transporter [Diaminobutyricibacter sp. McL0618]|uniref:CorA family divalent cation transporter n=1 Tax=Leifsonia sp. McL0618 TaxID=3415677 RepID=UPI003CF737D4